MELFPSHGMLDYVSGTENGKAYYIDASLLLDCVCHGTTCLRLNYGFPAMSHNLKLLLKINHSSPSLLLLKYLMTMSRKGSLTALLKHHSLFVVSYLVNPKLVFKILWLNLLLKTMHWSNCFISWWLEAKNWKHFKNYIYFELIHKPLNFHLYFMFQFGYNSELW